MTVNTARVAGRRDLNYESYEELLTDAEQLVAGPIETVGNWSPGQVFQHLANTMTMSLDGADSPAPWYIRVIAKNLFRHRFLTKKMPAGFKLPPAAERQLLPPETTTEAGFAAFRRAIERLKTEPDRHPHPALGPLSREEWDQLHLRHAELHMSFLRPGS